MQRFITIAFFHYLAMMLVCATDVAEAEEGEAKSRIGRTIAPFALNDVRGEEIKIQPSEDWRGVVVVFMGTECPLVKLYSPRLQALAKTYEPRGIKFIAINSNQQDSLSELTQFAKEHALQIPILKDLSNKIADAFGAERTPETFLLNATFQVVYRGRIDDQFTYGIQRPQVEREYLSQALDSLLANKKIEIPETETVGCHIGRILVPDEKSEVTYSKQIVRILQAHCVECHRTGEIGPFALTNYDEVVGWAEMMNEVVQQEKMPPWHANPKHGKFSNDVSLSDEEKQLIYRWVEAGAPRGNPADMPPLREFVTDWRIGKPDAIFAMSAKPFQVPANGEVRYQYFTVDPQFKEDTWIQAAECRPGNRSVVHHIIVGIAPPNGERKTQGALHSEWLTATAPGARPLQLPPGYAKLIPAGSKLVFQMHYTPNGKAATDLSSVGFVFADPKTVKKQVATAKAANNKFVIPPLVEKHPVKAVKTIDQNTLLLTFFPHMHLRGCSFRYTLQLPNGNEEILLDIPHYDFNWQNGYDLAEQRFIPAGSKIICDATFDNSAANLANPNPNASVRWGDQTWEEMMIGYFDMALADQDLTMPENRRTTQFIMQAFVSDVEVTTQLKSTTNKALQSKEHLETFALELRKTVPQLDRVCWTTFNDGKITIERCAQEAEYQTALPAATAGNVVNASLSKLSAYVKRDTPQVNADLASEKGFDLSYMAKKFKSSVHIPIQIEGKSGTLNFWSAEKDAFPKEAVQLLQDATGLIGK
jgi:peroxiredoxin